MDKLEQAFRKLAESCDKCGTNNVWKVNTDQGLKPINLCEPCLDQALGFKGHCKLNKYDKRGLERLRHYLERTPESIQADKEVYMALGIKQKPRESCKIEVF